MEYIVDGYNLLFADPDLFGGIERRRGAGARLECAGMIDAFCARTRAKALIVFDGHGVSISHLAPRTQVLFSGTPKSADDRIRQILEERAGPSGRSMKVVTSDRAVARSAKSNGLAVLSSEKFLKELRRRSGAPSESRAPLRDRALSPKEVDFWLKEFGLQ